ncbi:MAG: hypothetical protein WC723_00140 [Candidatus Omnitrophota bacterium]
MKKIGVVGLLSFWILGSLILAVAEEISWQDIGEGNADIRTVLVQPDNPRVIYIGSGNGVLKTEDAGKSWRNILLIKGQSKAVNSLLFSAANKKTIYAATANGLFYSINEGNRWSRIFQGKSYLERECTALAVFPGHIFLGTKAGLFTSKDNGRSWCKEAGKLGNSQILAIAYNISESDSIYAACLDGIFKTQDAGKHWERIFVAHPTEDGGDEDRPGEDRDGEEQFSDIRYISIDPNNLNYLYIASKKGVHKSQDKGKSWGPMSDYGLLNRDVKLLLISSDSIIYAAAKSGIFTYRNSRWQELSLGLVAQDVRYLDLDKQGNIYAACDKGLFKADISHFSGDKQKDIITAAAYYKDEPGINEVQEAAIKYAEVEPDKIKQWRKKAQMKAILPKLTVGLDNSRNTNYEIYTSATTHYVYEGPEDMSSGWDIALSWDLSELIWNEDQTSIDVRSRLMVELRGDILDEVTKLYFERRRVKLELDNLSIEDKRKRLEKELRLEELTASLDALTGGYFSRCGK